MLLQKKKKMPCNSVNKDLTSYTIRLAYRGDNPSLNIHFLSYTFNCYTLNNEKYPESNAVLLYYVAVSISKGNTSKVWDEELMINWQKSIW